MLEQIFEEREAASEIAEASLHEAEAAESQRARADPRGPPG